MSPLFLTGTGETPGVTLDKDSEIFEFTGKSLPEDAKEFYGPILSCSKDSTPDLTTTEAQTEVSTALATYDADIATMDNAQGIAVYN